ncbi:MAG: PP2C family protein-serine/threonine phosphatase [Phycisphaerales bacterium]
MDDVAWWDVDASMHEVSENTSVAEGGAAGADGADETRGLACMEVWGGNRAIDSAVEVPGLMAYVYSRPYKNAAAGGDVHYVSSCGTGRITRLMVADVAGHGDNVAELGVKLRDLMRRFINHLDQTKFVESLNREFAVASTAGRFATAIVATYWAETDFLVASNAGHPRPLWYRAKTRSWRVLKDRPRAEDTAQGAAPNNLPLGIDDVATYDQFAINLQPGDVVVFYSDSLTEAVNPEGEMLGEAGLLGLVQQLDTRDARRLGRQLIERIGTFCGGKTPDDDMTVMAMTCTGRKSAPTLKSKLGAVVSFIRTLAGSWRANAPPVPWPELSIVNILGPFIPAINRRWGGEFRQGEVRTGSRQ